MILNIAKFSGSQFVAKPCEKARGNSRGANTTAWRREGEERERESGDRERAGGDQLNKKTGTSIKRQNGKELEYQNQRSIKERRTLRKCTNRNRGRE